MKEGGSDIERYIYDKAGNMLRKTVAGKTTTFTFDDANQLVSSTSDGITTRYEYDALRVRRRGAYDQGRRQDGRRRFAVVEVMEWKAVFAVLRCAGEFRIPG